MRLITVIAGGLTVLTGVWCMANQGVTFSALAFIIGLVMILSGGFSAIGYMRLKERPNHMNWVISEGLLTVILGIMVITNQLATEFTIIIFFGTWVLVSGCNRLMASLSLKREKVKEWEIILGLAAVDMLAGIYAYLNNEFGSIAVGTLVSILIIIQGMNTIASGVIMPHERKKHHRRLVLKKAKEKAENCNNQS